jgi:hypothetical protein
VRDKKLNSITESKSEQLAWRSSKLETRNDEQSYKCWLNNYFFIGEIASPPGADRNGEPQTNSG